MFLISPFVGPVLGPIVGGYVTETIGWRWTIWILMIFSGCIWPLQVFAPETYAPYVLYRKAKRLQKAGHNVLPPKFRPFRSVLATALKRPPRIFLVLVSLTFRYAFHGAFRVFDLSLRIIPFRTSILLLPRIPVDVWSHLRLRTRLPRSSIHWHRTRHPHRQYRVHIALPLVPQEEGIQRCHESFPRSRHDRLGDVANQSLLVRLDCSAGRSLDRAYHRWVSFRLFDDVVVRRDQRLSQFNVSTVRR